MAMTRDDNFHCPRITLWSFLDYTEVASVLLLQNVDVNVAQDVAVFGVNVAQFVALSNHAPLCSFWRLQHVLGPKFLVNFWPFHR